MPLKENIRCAIIGGSLDGKTFLCAGIARGLWNRHRLRSIVFDPFKGETDFGKSAWVTADFEAFTRAVFNTKGCAVFWDEGTATGGRDRDNLKFFTAIRHNHPAFFFIGHGYATMLPIMRGSLSEVIMAVRDPDDAAEWAKVMVDREVLRATTLKQYEFLHKRKHRPVSILRYSKKETLAGVFPFEPNKAVEPPQVGSDESSA